MIAATATAHTIELPGVLDRLLACSPEAELWWDSSPVIYESWMNETLREAPEKKRASWFSQLARFFDPVCPGDSLARGATTNPILLGEVLMRDPGTWIPRIHRLREEVGADDPDALLRRVYRETIRAGAALLEPLFRASGGRFGWISAQVNPQHVFDAAAMIEEGHALASIAPNVMVKIPGSREGYEVIEALTAEAISTNNTLTYTVTQLRAFAEAISRGLRKARQDGVILGSWRAVFTFMTSRCGRQGMLAEQAKDRGQTLSETDLRWAEVAIAKRMHELIEREKWPVKLLLSSMRTASDDEPAACLHLEETAGSAIVYTCPPSFIRDVIRREDCVPSLDPEAIRRSVPTERARRFIDLPYFRACCEPGGVDEREFNHLTPLLGTLWDFVRGMERTRDFIERAAV